MLIVLAISAQLTAATPVDTPTTPARPRAQAVEVSEWYARRLALHRWMSLASYPLFAFQYAAGKQKWDKGDSAPEWAHTGHRIGAAAIAGVFTVNTVTGVWNLIESRNVSEGRALRYLHAASMLAADAGFFWAGAVLSEQAARSARKKRQHRTVALTSIGISVTSSTMMWFFNR